MKKNSKTLLFAILGALTLSGCEFPFAGTNSTSTNKVSSTVSNTSSENKTSSSTSELTGDALILDNLKAKILIPQAGATVVDNFELPTTVKYKDYVGNLTWTSNHGSILVDNQKHTVTDENSGATYEVYKAIVIRPEAGSGDANVTLTATVTYNNLSDTKSFKTTVKQADVVTNTEWGVSKNLAVSPWSDWVAATSGDIAVQGVVTAAIYQEGYKNGNVFLQDANGGYYAYGVDMSLEYFNNYFRVGNEVIVEGQKTIYNGLHEFNLKTVNYVKVLDSTGERPAPIDVTEAAASKENGIRNYQAMWVEATGMYIEADSKSYLQFGDYKYELYIDAKYCGDALETVNEQVETFNPGDTVKVTGLVGCYNADQFHPYNLEKQEGTVLTPEQKVAVEASNVDAVLSSYSGKTLKETTTINLHTSNDVTITYTLNDEADKSVFALENNTLTVTPVTDLKEATVTATIAYQGVTETKTYTIGAQLPLVAPTDVYSYEITSAAFGLTNSYNSSEETKAIDGVEFAYIQLADYGDGIQMRDKDGKTSRLWNTNAFGNGIERIEITLSDSKTVYDNPDAVIFNFGSTNEVSSYSTKLSTVAGTKTYTITPDVNTYTYFYLEHDISYTFYYKSIKVILNGYTGEEPSNPDTPVEPEIPTEPVECTIAEALAAADDTPVIVRGIVKSADTWNTQYSNMSVTIIDENLDELYIFRLGTQVAVGDDITVTGKMDTYNNARQIAQGATAVINSTNNEIPAPETPDTPVTPGEAIAAPVTFDAADAVNINTTYGAHNDLQIGGYDFSLSCGNLYSSSGKAVVVGLNKDKNIGNVGTLPTEISATLGDKVTTGTNAVNASLIMDFDLTGVSKITYNFLKIAYASGTTTTVYILRSIDGGNTYTIAAQTTDSKASSLSYTEETTSTNVRYALAVTGFADASYAAQARVSSIVVE